MKLPQPFYRLPIRVDVDRLRDEVRALPASAWDGHPSDFAGNSVARLITVGGGENDEVSGAMAPTPHLLASPYIRQVLASFGVVWSRSRLMRLAPGTGVPEHADINYHWFNRVRVHIPVITRPEVRFHCGDQSVHMAAGEAWIFDNWRRHRVENPAPHERIHLVADTTGSAAFWRMVMEGQAAQVQPRTIAFEPGMDAALLTECHNAPAIMPPSEVEVLLGDLGSDLQYPGGDGDADAALARFRSMLVTLAQEWRQLWSLHADSPAGAAHYARLREATRDAARKLAGPICMRTNQVPVLKVLEGRVLQHLLRATPAAPLATRTVFTPRSAPSGMLTPRFERPLIIVAAPRSGSTLLFETLASSPQLWTVGGEAHWLVEGFDVLRPGAPGVDSNRLTGQHCSDDIARRIREQISANLVDASGAPWRGEPVVRFLEKTPKNALRIPFFERLFPDARYLFLWRGPQENISSIMEAWKSGQWITYPELPAGSGPWSLLLPPGWPSVRGRPLEEIAAWQWSATNDIVLEDLQRLPRERWHAVSYADLVANPATIVRSVCSFAGIAFDPALAARTAAPLPLARHTLTPPQPGKWQSNRGEIERALPAAQSTWDRLRAL